MSEEVLYVCERCGEAFSLEEGRTLYTDVGNETLCPSCGSADLETGERCKVCREIVPDYEIRSGVCKGCFEDAVSAYKAALNCLTWEREVLDDEYGNIDITEQ